MATQSDVKLKIPLIGLLAVKNLLVTKEELQKGLSQCSKEKNPDLALKEYFLENQLISAQNIERLSRAAKTLELRQKEFKFGAIAIRKGFINQSVLKLALEEQENDIRNKRKLRLVGDMLVEAGMLTEKQRDYILKLQQRVRMEVKKNPEEKITEVPGEERKIVLKDQKTNASEVSTKDSDDGEIEAGDLLEPEIIDGGIKLEISKDFMAAFLSKTDYFDKNITLVQLKETLFDKGIVLGIVEDKMIEGFINSSGFKTKSFRIAKGVSPIQGKDAKVEFFFNTDYLKAGGLTNDGAIDFKDRGEIPHIEEGTVLAEKIPMVEARWGHNIFGDEIETMPGKDIVLKLGKGAKLSEDGIKVLAAVKGFPKYALSGHIFVHQEYITEGDVDYETGHIQYDGNVNIKGRIKSGFKVKGNDIQAIELDGGIVHADGNVRIAGGINEGKIYARGNVYAKFIHKSEVICMGDVIIEKEIVDADVECSGRCVTENG
ncbi:MAG: FapA family protein, partial [Proteobacteria bacterium]|nr:FapA family protein [Pseudomonadota bacterium]